MDDHTENKLNQKSELNSKPELNSAHKLNNTPENKLRHASSDRLESKIQNSNESDLYTASSKENNTQGQLNVSTSDPANTTVDYRPSKFVTQENRNTLDAEREYQEKLRQHPGDQRFMHEDDAVDNSFQPPTIQSVATNTGTTASGTTNTSALPPSSHALDKKGEYIVSSGGIRRENMRLQPDLLGASEVQLSSNKRLRLSGFGETTTQMVGRTSVMAFSMAVSQTEAGEGLRYAEVAVRAGTLVTTELIRKRLNAPLRAELIRKYGTANPQVALRDINRTLRANNIQTLHGKGSNLANLSARNLRKLKASGKIIPMEVQLALQQGEELGRLTTFQDGKRGRISGLTHEVSSILMRQISQTEAGQGLRITSTVVSRTTATLRRILRLARNNAHLVAIAARKAMLESVKLASKRAAKAVEKAGKAELIGDTEKAGELTKEASRLSEKAQKRKGRLEKTDRFGNKVSRLKERISDPFGLKRKLREARKQFSLGVNRVMRSYFPGFSKMQKINKAIAKFFAKIANVVRSLLTAAFAALGSGLIILIVAAIVVAIMTVIFGSFDLSDDDKRAIAIQTLQECYDADLEKIANLNYHDIEIMYEDLRDEDTYTEKKAEADAKSFFQSSNCAEILAMTFVWAEHDFGSVSEHQLKSYVQGLWYGSHDIIVQEQTIIREDDEGNQTIIKNAIVTYRTYYFDSLFDCKQRSSPAPIQYIGGAGDVAGCANSWNQIYIWLRNNGFTFVQTCAIMGNLSFETGGCANNNNAATITYDYFIGRPPDPTTDTYMGYGIFQMMGGRKQNAQSYITSFGGDIYSTESQLKAWKYEIQTDSYESSQWAKVAVVTDPREAGVSFATNVERCAAEYRSNRGTMAEKISIWYAAYADDWNTLIPTGQQIADYAQTFAGKLHYAGDGRSWRGWSLSTTNGGTDCSGFVALIYQSCLPNAQSQNFVGTAASYYDDYLDYVVDDPQPGDVVVNAGKTHTGIYIGGGMYVNASWYNCGNCSKTGGPCDNDCKISTVPDGSYYIRIWQAFE